jgi:quercetin dioxygenase-like cupin family protein
MTIANSDLLNQQAAQYVAGSMTACELAEWELLLATDRSPESLATAEYEGALLELTAGILPVAPPPQLKATILEQIATPKGFTFRFADNASFRPTPVAGITYRLLSRDHEQNRVTCLLRLAPGARLPAHTHPGVEECVVLEGTVMVGQIRMHAGDYQRAEADSEHLEQWSDTGALVYLSSPDDLFLQG